MQGKFSLVVLALLAALGAHAADGPQELLGQLAPLPELMKQSACEKAGASVRHVQERMPKVEAEVALLPADAAAGGDLLKLASRGPRLQALLDSDRFCARKQSADLKVDRDIWRLGLEDAARTARSEHVRRCANPANREACSAPAALMQSVKQAIWIYLGERHARFERHRESALQCVAQTEADVAAIVPHGVPAKQVPTVARLRAELWSLAELAARLQLGVCESAVEQRLQVQDNSARL